MKKRLLTILKAIQLTLTLFLGIILVFGKLQKTIPIEMERTFFTYFLMIWSPDIIYLLSLIFALRSNKKARKRAINLI